MIQSQEIVNHLFQPVLLNIQHSVEFKKVKGSCVVSDGMKRFFRK